jgi:hypothetical protein
MTAILKKTNSNCKSTYSIIDESQSTWLYQRKGISHYGELTMTEAKSNHKLRGRRLFPHIQSSPEKIAQWKAETEALYQRCKLIFDRLQPQLIKTHNNSYIVIEPDSGNYILDSDKIAILHKVRQTYPNTKTFLFRINETGVSGTI